MIKKTISSVSENILIKYFIIRKKFENFLSPIFDPKKKERGLIPLLIIGGIFVVGAIWSYIKVKKDIGTAIGTAGESFFDSLITGLGMFLIAIASAIFNVAASFLQYVLGPEFMKKSITGNETFVTGWRIVRDIANMLIVLGFVVIGIATALRIKEYQAQKTLVPLILIAILINFSPVFVGLIIDASNITMAHLTEKGATGTITEISLAINKYLKAELTGTGIDTTSGVAPKTELSPGVFLAKCAGLALFELIAAYTFAILAILLAARYAILAVLFILSPLAFFCLIFPATKKLWTTWWENFLKWCFIGVSTCFFIFLAMSVLNASKTSDFNTFLVVFIFLIVGYKLAKSGSAMGATAVLGLATGAAGFVAGKVAGGAKAVGGKVGGAIKESKAGQAVGGAFSKTMEAMHLQKKGTTAQQKQERGQEALKRVKAQYAEKGGEEKMKKALEGKGVMPPQDRAAWAALAAEKGEINPKDDRHKALLARAESYGFDRSAWEKADYRLAGFNDKKVAEISKKQGIPLPQAQQRAVEQQLEENLPSMSHNQLRKIDSPHLSYNLVSKRFTPDKISAFRTGSTAQIIQLKNHIGSPSTAPGGATGLNKAAQDANADGNKNEFDRLNKLINEINRL